MSLEIWSTIASIGTFVVIAATAVAALLQLRHMRSSNQIAAITAMSETMASDEFLRAYHFVTEEVPKLLADPAGRSKLGAKVWSPEIEPVRVVGNFFERMGVFVKLRIIDRSVVCDLFDGVVFKAWKQLEPVVLIRRKVSSPGTWTSFEYLAVLSERSLLANSDGYYPPGVRRMKCDEKSIATAEAFERDRADIPQP
jgi:hypothetical protein